MVNKPPHANLYAGRVCDKKGIKPLNKKIIKDIMKRKKIMLCVHGSF